MAIDPKYANLPGIDTDAPDVYETSDLPESDQNLNVEDEEDPVETIGVTADEAFKQFKGKNLNAKDIDFSDKISRSRRTGYDVPRTEYEMLGEGPRAEETPMQKYQRLQHEIRELAESVNTIKDNVKAEASTENLSPVAMAKQVEYLQHQLTDLHLDKLMGDSSTINLADPQGALQKRLLMQLNTFKPQQSSADGKSAPEANKDHVTYQLYYRPEQAKFSNNAKVADLEQRLERMEALVGTAPEKLSALTVETTSKSLVGAVGLLSARTKLLDPVQIEHIEGRLASLNQKLGQINDKKDALESVEKQNKIAELYELVKKWDGLLDTLPQVVDRLTSLKDLHEQALQFSQALTHLDTSQQEVSGLLKSHGDMLKQVQSTLSDNLGTIKSNCESLDKRMQKLSKESRA